MELLVRSWTTREWNGWFDAVWKEGAGCWIGTIPTTSGRVCSVLVSITGKATATVGSCQTSVVLEAKESHYGNGETVDRRCLMRIGVRRSRYIWYNKHRPSGKRLKVKIETLWRGKVLGGSTWEKSERLAHRSTRWPYYIERSFLFIFPHYAQFEIEDTGLDWALFVVSMVPIWTYKLK